MPQLSFDREHSPKRITVQLQWDQLADRYSLSVWCHAQDEGIQGSMSKDLGSTFRMWQLSIAVAGVLENWLSATPKLALAQLHKELEALHPTEVPFGLQLDDPVLTEGLSLGGVPVWRDGRGKPRLS